MKRTITYVALGAVAIAAIVVAIVLGTQGQTAERQTRSAMVERSTILVTVSASGSIQARARAGLTFELPGRVTSVYVKTGDRVKAGDALAQLDTRQLELQVTQAEVTLALAESRLAQLRAGPQPEEIAAAEANLRAAQAQVNSAIATLNQIKAGPTQAQIAAAQSQVASAELQHKLAQQNYDRVRSQTNDQDRIEQAGYDLYVAEKTLAAAQAERDRLLAGANTNDVRSAQANVWAATARQNAAQARLDLLLAGATPEQLADAEAQVDQARAALEQAQLMLTRATLRAPFDGIVAGVNISAGEAAPVGRPAIVLLDDSSFRVTVSVDEMDVDQLEEGQTVQVALDALPDAIVTGTVTSIAPAALLTNGVIYYDVLIDLAPTDAPIRADMTATVTVLVKELPDVLTIPSWVVHVDRQTGQTYVNREVGNSVERVDVTLGVRYQGVVQVLDGLSEGDVVVWIQQGLISSLGEQQ